VPKILSFLGEYSINISDSISYILLKINSFALQLHLGVAKGIKKNTLCMKKEYENESPHSSLRRHLLIKLESFGDKIGYRFLCKRESIWFGNAMIDGINEMIY